MAHQKASANAGDQALFALLAQCPNVRARRDAAGEKRDASEGVYFGLRPQAPVAKADDNKFLFLFSPRIGKPYDDQVIANLRATIDARGVPSDDAFPFAKAFDTHARQIIAEWEAYRLADEAAREKCGVAAAQRDDLAAHAAMIDMFYRIATSPATSVEGALAKIAAVADRFEGFEQSPEDCTADDVVFSAACDIGRIVPKTSVAQSRRRTKAKK